MIFYVEDLGYLNTDHIVRCGHIPYDDYRLITVNEKLSISIDQYFEIKEHLKKCILKEPK